MSFQYQVRAGARADAYNDENDQVSSTTILSGHQKDERNVWEISKILGN